MIETLEGLKHADEIASARRVRDLPASSDSAISPDTARAIRTMSAHQHGARRGDQGQGQLCGPLTWKDRPISPASRRNEMAQIARAPRRARDSITPRQAGVGPLAGHRIHRTGRFQVPEREGPPSRGSLPLSDVSG